RVFSSWVPKMAGWCTLSRASVGHAAQFSAYLRSMLRHCLLLIGALPVATAPAAGQHADTLRDRLEARIARAPAQAVGLYSRSLSRPDSVLIGANLRLHAASTMKVPVLIQIFQDADAGRPAPKRRRAPWARGRFRCCVAWRTAPRTGRG